MALVVSGGPHLGGSMSGVGEAHLWVEDVGLDGTPYYRLNISFREARGYGDRDYKIRINHDSFKALAEAMIRANREEAIRAFGAALQVNVAAQPTDRYWSPATTAEPKAAAAA